jgi:transposase, IS30 family
MTEGRTHLTPEERCQIEVLLRRGDSQRVIAKLLSRPPSTIRREIKRNRGAKGYRTKQAQTKAEERRAVASQSPRKMKSETVTLIEEKLTQYQWSPEQISGWMKAVGTESVSHERIYRHIWADKESGGELYKHLRHSGKKYNKRKGKTSGRGLIPRRVDIDQRPSIVAEKTRLGDWEIDTVIGANHKGVLVTAVDRASKYAVIEAVENKSAAAVTEALVRRLGSFQGKVLTITADNGKEFAEHEKITAMLGSPVYFAKPYHSWERGLNEHTNGLIRQYLPKGLSFENVTAADVDKIEHLLNNRPRKALGFKTPQEAFSTPPPGAFHC